MTSELLHLPGESWRDLPAGQQPDWPDQAALREVLAELAIAPPLVYTEECDRLTGQLGAVARGEAFVLQGGDCAETFAGMSAEATKNKLKTLLQMAVVFTYAGSMPVVKLGRLAGQYAKPRSGSTETKDGVTLPVYRGDAVNGFDFTARSREPDPRRLWRAYQSSAITLNLVRAFATGGYASLDQVHAWNQDFVADSPAGARYDGLARDIDRALNFMRACGAEPEQLHQVEFFASHEGLLLDYEAALTRVEPTTGAAYATSGHLIWAGERTRELDGAHIAYLSGINNPVAVKLGPSTTPEEALAYAEALNPRGEPGRLTFITRMGAGRVRERLPELVKAVDAAGVPIVWICDPMHGNTFTGPTGHKTRLFADVLDEVRGFFEVHRAAGTHPGGIHVEFTGEDVTECLGGGMEILFHHLPDRYESTCDPRLNRGQSLDLAFLAAQML
ncbi:3-deoxy-7-phosphoheptulonate synthase class II [Amycolatopsis antarctica]|uniref:Phospho-2-dehydro-3-deoxyheptonate aldolase n=1 Tax=Amycolatopsis antarctica TaxID=1854586 RepID=A0A263D5X8_9PSEU|nr:3-deoxy-7-phosphoheptulonate synthase class II [Amycolatopsis antarctica]OZM73599.1 3-deoxy-7-phosphoheptulonate synthase class II [Amycolatopsis antarctica]